MSIPFTVAGRSPVDPIRLRWAGLGCVALGVAVVFQTTAAAIAFGSLLVLLGIATWVVTRFGSTLWPDLPDAAKAVAGTGALVGLVFLASFFLIFFLVIGLFKLIASWM